VTGKEGDSLPIEFLQSVEPPLQKREQLSLVDKTKATANVGKSRSRRDIRYFSSSRALGAYFNFHECSVLSRCPYSKLLRYVNKGLILGT
jgi:hypothetical protein